MTIATSFLWVSFAASCLVSLYYFWTMNELASPRASTREEKLNGIKVFLEGWKKSLLIWVILLILYFIYYGSLMVTMVETSTFYDEAGNIISSYKTEDYRLGWEFLKIEMGLMYISTAVLIWRIFNQTQILFIVLGTKFKQKKPSKYQDFI
jgi:hypothetical protein